MTGPKAIAHSRNLASTKVLDCLAVRGAMHSDAIAAKQGLSQHQTRIAIGYLCHEGFAKQVRKVDVPGWMFTRWTYEITAKGRNRLDEIMRDPEPRKPKLKPQAVAPLPSALRGEMPPAIKPGHTETIEEFQARGGRVEKLPCEWPAPTRYPRVGGIS